jgi:hypothetical protein
VGEGGYHAFQWSYGPLVIVLRLHKLVVGGIADVELGCAVEEVGVDWCCIGDATVRAWSLASVLVD